MVKICLCMIVKNEEGYIEKCLESVKESIDYVYILDTGSEDKTGDIIKNWCRNNKIEHKIDTKEFTTFCEMREKAFLGAKKKYESDYILLLDAKQRLKGKIEKNELKKDGYDILQIFHNISYMNIRLIKGNLNWKCKGVVHEYWECPREATRGILKNVEIVYSDKKEKSEDRKQKIKHYLELMLNAVKTEKDEFLISRYIFYIANSFFDLENYEKAIEYYDKRFYMGFSKDEKWYCVYRTGLCYEKLEKDNMAIPTYLAAFDFMPSRAEPMYRLAVLYRRYDMLSISFHFAKSAKEIKNKNNGLFVENDIYEYLIDYEISISGSYINKEIGKKSFMYLETIIDKIPEPFKKSIINNKYHYSRD